MTFEDTGQANTKEKGAYNDMNTVETSSQVEGGAVDGVRNSIRACVKLKPLEKSKEQTKKHSGSQGRETRGYPTCFQGGMGPGNSETRAEENDSI